MTRLGAIILSTIILAVIGFASMLSFDHSPKQAVPPRDVAAASEPPAAASRGGLRVPVAGVSRTALRDSWEEARENGARGHHGTDIMARAGTPVIAAADGWVEKLFDSERGGITLYQRSADRRWTYYYAHLAGYAPGVREGMRVRAGQVLGYVGDTGDAGAGNYHLHFGVTRMRGGERWWQGEDINPYPLLARQPAGR
ncbi:M23 family metallopeptidase [Sphingomonas sp.]|uniref:M23 family metallopeptidase n=1 Tax=Sphingomonas sp. TaxID=28214 RepID=UPI0035C81F11